jgi:hypothetical protein
MLAVDEEWSRGKLAKTQPRGLDADEEDNTIDRSGRQPF